MGKTSSGGLASEERIDDLGDVYNERHRDADDRTKNCECKEERQDEQYPDTDELTEITVEDLSKPGDEYRGDTCDKVDHTLY